MGWIRKSPFGSHEAPLAHGLDLLAKEADTAGVPLTDAERSVLLTQPDPENLVSEELHAKTTKLVNLMLDHQPDIDDPKSFGNSSSASRGFAACLEARQGLSHRLALPSECAWVVVWNNVLLIVPRDQTPASLREFYRIAKPGARTSSARFHW